MELVFDILLVFIYVILFGLVILLVMPFSIRLQGSLKDLDASGWIYLSWAFEFVQIKAQSSRGIRLFFWGLPVYRFDIGSKRRSKKEQPKKPKRSSKPKAISKTRSFWKNRSVWLWASKRMLNTLHLKGQIEGTLGPGDPADAAYISVLLMQLESHFEKFRCALQLDYTEEVIDLKGNIRAWFVPGHIGLVALALFFDRDVRLAMRN